MDNGRTAPLWALTDEALGAAMGSSAGRERARQALTGDTPLTAANRRRIFEALTDAETAAGENP